VGEVTVAGGSLNQMLVRDGLTRWYRRYAPNDTELQRLQRQARNTNRGAVVEAGSRAAVELAPTAALQTAAGH